jgi:hypothetical protein
MRWLMFLLLVGTTVGQNPAPSPNPTPTNETAKAKTVRSPAVTKCRSALDSLKDQEFEDFQEFPTTRLKELREILETCLRDSYDGMTKYQLASAGIMLEWTQRTIYQRYVDEDSAGTLANNARKQR